MLRVFQMANHAAAVQTRPHGDGETEWGGVGARVDPGQNQMIFVSA